MKLPFRLMDIEDNSNLILLINFELTENGTKFCKNLSLDEIEKEDLSRTRDHMDIRER